MLRCSFCRRLEPKVRAHNAYYAPCTSSACVETSLGGWEHARRTGIDPSVLRFHVGGALFVHGLTTGSKFVCPPNLLESRGVTAVGLRGRRR